MALDSHIEKVLWNAGQISDRVADLAAEITADFSPDSPAPILIGVATGAFVFLADLAREIKLPISVDFIRADSYGSGTESSGAPKVSLDLKIDVKGKHVIVVSELCFSIPHSLIKTCLQVEFDNHTVGGGYCGYGKHIGEFDKRVGMEGSFGCFSVCFFG
ncbi:Hypoxanthine-guanine phosphoribosyltransferase [Linum perenne]